MSLAECSLSECLRFINSMYTKGARKIQNYLNKEENEQQKIISFTSLVVLSSLFILINSIVKWNVRECSKQKNFCCFMLLLKAFHWKNAAMEWLLQKYFKRCLFLIFLTPKASTKMTFAYIRKGNAGFSLTSSKYKQTFMAKQLRVLFQPSSFQYKL